MKSSTTHVSQKQARGKKVSNLGLPDPSPVLLASDLAPTEVARLLQAYGIEDWKRADHNLQAMAGDPTTRKTLAGILYRLLSSLSQTADPDQALNEWERYVDSGIHRLALFQYLEQALHVIDVLGSVFGNSQAMAQTLIRDPLLVYWIEEDRVLVRRQTRSRLIGQLHNMLDGVKSFEAKCEALRRCKRREMLRVGIRDLLGIATPIETYTALSDLAAEVIQAAYELVDHELQCQHGSWDSPSSTGKDGRTGFSVLAMGKLGGWELNYSSDVDLIYVYQAPSGKTHAGKGQQAISGPDYFDALARELTAVLSTATAEGALFRVDLRLRPEGHVGPLACSLEDADHYYQTRGRTWERLAFLKAYPIAGNVRVGRALIRKLKNFVYGTEETASHVFPAIHSLRGQMVSKLTRRGELERNVKLGTGGIREIEFIVQGLQLRWGYGAPNIRDRQTLNSLTKLVRTGKLTDKVAGELKESYLFLRNLENKLQMVHELQTHLLPSKTEDLAKCAIRLGYPKAQTVDDTTKNFLQVYRHHTQRVHRHYQTVLGKHPGS